MVTLEEMRKWKKACKISGIALHHGAALIKKGTPMIEVCDAIDKKMIELGAFPAFPAQISVNDTAAHYCCPVKDETILENQVCKIDVGAHIDGFPGDNALTIDLSGENSELVAAAKNALYAAIKIVKPGIKLGQIGEVIQSEIMSKGFSPIRNLSGHGVSQFNLHAKPTVPNFNNNDKNELVSGQIVAIEPFATDGEGIIYEGSNPEVFMVQTKKPVRVPTTRKIQDKLDDYKGLPFAMRWLMEDFPKYRVEMAIRELVMIDAIQAFPPLIEKGHGFVSQFEHTVLVTDSGCQVLTKF